MGCNDSMKRINGELLKTCEEFRIELPSGGSWCMWQDTTIFIGPAQSGMVCRAYKIDDSDRTKSPEIMNLGERYCIYLWTIDMEHILETNKWKQGWLTTSGRILQMTGDPDRRSAFMFTAPAAGQISPYSYIVTGTRPSEYKEGKLTSMQGATAKFLGGVGEDLIVGVQGGIINKEKSFAVGGYWVTFY